MKIAFYSHLFLPNLGGAEIQLHNLATEQVRAGHDATVILQWSKWRSLGNLRARLDYRVLPLLPRLSTIAMRSLGQKRDLTWLVGSQFRFWQKRHGFDVWHVHGGYPSGVLVARALKRMGIPAVLTCHGEDINTLPEIGYGVRLDPERNRQMVSALRQYNGLIAISQSIASQYAEAGVAAERVFHVPNGVDVSRIKRTVVNVADVRKAHGLPSDRPLLLTVGRNHPVKGYELIPQTARKLSQAGCAFTWLLIGRGTEKIVEQALRLGLGDRVRALHVDIGEEIRLDSLPTEEAIQLYRAADLLVFPTRLESFGLVIVEAMAAGLPVVASEAPGVRDIIQHKETGLLIPVGDSNALAQGIRTLLDDPELRARMAQRARLEAERFDLHHVAQSCIDVYRRVAFEKASGSAKGHFHEKANALATRSNK